MKIDIFAHILPEKYLTALRKKVDLNDYSKTKCRATKCRAIIDLGMRLKLMDRYPDQRRDDYWSPFDLCCFYRRFCPDVIYRCKYPSQTHQTLMMRHLHV